MQNKGLRGAGPASMDELDGIYFDYYMFFEAPQPNLSTDFEAPRAVCVSGGEDADQAFQVYLNKYAQKHSGETPEWYAKGSKYFYVKLKGPAAVTGNTINGPIAEYVETLPEEKEETVLQEAVTPQRF